MNSERVQLLRELLVVDRKGTHTVVMEFSYDDGFGRDPRFFGVPFENLAAARQLYHAWGGSRRDGNRIGTTVRRPYWKV